MNPKKRLNVKSGCRTCKVRKVKCDESRPICERCLSTGRVCDGYGIWGGGGNQYGQQQRVLAVMPCPKVVSSPEDAKCYEWFRLRTSNKLPASYKSGFWNTLVFQASFNEPAIWHAVLALGSFHHRTTVTADSAGDGPERQQGEMMLRHFSKAVQHLQPHFEARNQFSYRVALVACVLFATLNLLQGYVQQARIHLDNGRNIMTEMKLLYPQDDKTLYVRKGQCDTDDTLVEAWARLDFQYQLWQFSNKNQEARPMVMEELDVSGEEHPFECILQAWKPLQRYLEEAMRLSELARCHRGPKHQADAQDSKEYGDRQNLIANLSRWLKNWESFTHLHLQSSIGERKVNWLLRCFHIMAVIMAETCIDPRNELMYDLETHNFVSLIVYSIKLHQISAEEDSAQVPLSDQRMGASKSIVDLGIIQPLFYVATKCRVRRLRTQAIRLLESSAHREGLMESRLAGFIARKIMAKEEGPMFAKKHLCSDFPLWEDPVDPKGLSAGLPPREQRISLLGVEILGEPMCMVSLRYTIDSATGNGAEFTTTYNIRLNQ